MSSRFQVPRWVTDLPGRPCPAHDGSDLSDNPSVKDPNQCWRVYTSNADVKGLPSGMKQFRCTSWEPAEADFQTVVKP